MAIDDGAPAAVVGSAPSSGFLGGLGASFMSQLKVAREKERSLLASTMAFASRTLTAGASPAKSETNDKLPTHI